ncbi:hypothetical protein ACFFOS_27645 [Nocardioides kongjuensis]|uniref:HK97 gp10 family phage protein n=1 Tax=Nocardioides kongjuensis TaxID=349522 RepID=A0A852RSI5_9ACTN|nr:hypothetical protein [Nocardioides kongjuensis]NYD33845.1 hypothetical protein [Nocardioides kongjuensis]
MTQILDVDVDAAPVRAAFASLRLRLRNLSRAWALIGARMESAAQPVVPVESGRLVDSLKATAGPMGVEFASDLVYAGVQDRGWPAHGIEGHHFMSRAEEALRGDAVDLLAPEIQRQIDAVGLG